MQRQIVPSNGGARCISQRVVSQAPVRIHCMTGTVRFQTPGGQSYYGSSHHRRVLPAGRAPAAGATVTVCRAAGGGGRRQPQQQQPERDDPRRSGTYMPVRRQVPSSRTAGAATTSITKPPSQPPRGSPAVTTVRRSDLVNKQIVTRVEGKQLGQVTDLWIDTRHWEVVSLDCQPPSNLLKGTLDKVTSMNTLYSVLLGSLRQIGDVVLVQDIRALEVEDCSYGYSNIMSWEVRDESGSILGKVRDFHFSPDNGAVAGMVFDMFGSPIVPPSAVSTYSIGIEQVLRAENGKITVMNGYRAQQLSVGFLDKFLNVAEQQIGPLFEDLVPEEEEEYQRRLEKWKEEMAEYERQYGPMPAEVRRRAETSLQPQDRTVQQWPQQQQQGRQAEAGAAPRRQEDRERGPPRGQQVASIPIISQRRRGAAYEQRDADGGFGERPPPRRRKAEEQPPQPQPSVSFDEWVQEEEGIAEVEPLAVGYEEAGRARWGTGSQGSASLKLEEELDGQWRGDNSRSRGDSRRDLQTPVDRGSSNMRRNGMQPRGQYRYDEREP